MSERDEKLYWLLYLLFETTVTDLPSLARDAWLSAFTDDRGSAFDTLSLADADGYVELLPDPSDADESLVQITAEGIGYLRRFAWNRPLANPSPA